MIVVRVVVVVVVLCHLVRSWFLFCLSLLVFGLEFVDVVVVEVVVAVVVVLCPSTWVL